jgi:hypothetical protein
MGPARTTKPPQNHLAKARDSGLLIGCVSRLPLSRFLIQRFLGLFFPRPLLAR